MPPAASLNIIAVPQSTGDSGEEEVEENGEVQAMPKPKPPPIHSTNDLSADQQRRSSFTSDAGLRSAGSESQDPAASVGLRSAGSSSSIAIQESVQQFERDRKEERRARIRKVVNVNFVCSGPGLVLFTIGYAVRKLGGVPFSAAGNVAVLLGYVLFGAGLTMASVCPLDELDLDVFVPRHRRAALVVSGGFTCIGLYTAAFTKGVFRYVWMPRLLVSLLMILGTVCRRAAPWLPLQSTLYASWAITTGGACIAAPIELLREEQCQELPVHRVSSYIFGLCLFVYAVCYCRRWCGRARAWWPAPPPTLGTWHSVYAFYWTYGANSFFTAVLIFLWPPACMEEMEFFLWNVEMIPRGLFFVFTAAAVLYLGRHRAFDIIARPSVISSFENARSKQDGTFLAELLDKVTVEVGSTWWVHHGQNNASYGQYDPRRNWDRGEVVRIKDGHFDVKLQSGYVCLPMASRGMSSEAMMEYAKNTLRCIDWLQIVARKQELFFSDAADGQSGALTQLTGGNLFDCSRAVKPGEQIDFFMSHSWHDDRAVKWRQLEGFAKHFYSSRGRYPTLWLDNVCIDQSKIGEGLRVLPINLMSCQKLLIVTGRTYPTRLWCAWEMITLFAFSDLAHAVDRVEVLPINDGSDFDALEELERFEVSRARCYDPNEEARLREVIAAVGEDKFNARVRTLAAAVRARSKGRGGAP